MAVEIFRSIEVVGHFLPLLAITALQAKAIIARDGHCCIFPFQHQCKGRLTIHHIDGKEDDPNNLGSVCHEAHWHYLHNGRVEADILAWRAEMAKIASEHTKEARGDGWMFPE